MRGEQAVEVVAAEEGVAADGEHLVIAEATTDDRHVKGSAAKVVDEIGRVVVFLDPGIVNRGSSWFVQQLDDLETGLLAGLAGVLDLVVIEVRRHRDDGAIEEVARVSEGGGKGVATVHQDTSRYLNGS